MYMNTYESGRVVILDRLCVAEGLEDRIGLQELLLQLALKMRQGPLDKLSSPLKDVEISTEK